MMMRVGLEGTGEEFSFGSAGSQGNACIAICLLEGSLRRTSLELGA